MINELTQHVLCLFVNFEGSVICGCEFVVIWPKSRPYAVVVNVVVFFVAGAVASCDLREKVSELRFCVCKLLFELYKPVLNQLIKW